MATNPLQLKLESSPIQKKRIITCKSKSASFKRIILIYGNTVEYFSGSGLDTAMKLVNKETSLVITDAANVPLPVILLFLGADSVVHGAPMDPFQMLTVEEPIFHNMKMTHVVEIRCNHPKTKQLQCILNVEIPMS